MSRRLVAAFAFVFTGLVVVSPAGAQERVQLDLSVGIAPGTAVPPVVLAAGQVPVRFGNEARRPGPSALMTSLYASTAVMQALDVHSTLLALDRGAVEANPLMSGATRNRAAFVALKAGVALSTVMAAKNMSKRNKVAAVLTLVAINSAYAMIVNHNYNVARRAR